MKVAVIMGSKSDLPVMQDAIDTLALFEIETHVDIVSRETKHDGLFVSPSSQMLTIHGVS